MFRWLLLQRQTLLLRWFFTHKSIQCTDYPGFMLEIFNEIVSSSMLKIFKSFLKTTLSVIWEGKVEII